MITMVVGEFPAHTKEAMTAACQRAGAQCIFVGEGARALGLIGSLDTPPRCIFVSIKDDLGWLAERLRDSLDFYTIPIVGLVPFPCSNTYQEANRLGADDCIPTYDTGGMTRRLANLLQGQPPRLPDANEGKAIVAVSDVTQRRQVGRRLRTAGYEVEFVSREKDLATREDATGEDGPALVVTTPSFMPTKRPARRGRPRAQTKAPTVTVPRSTGGAVAPRKLSDPEVVERLMFLVDEATRPGGHEARRSRRIQHGAICTFRQLRSFEHCYALTDNISRQGLYLRTLDPPPRGMEVKIDLRDKFGDILQIRGTVAWRHAPSSVGGRTCPGFGLSIDEAACPPQDLEKYHALYDDVLKEVEDAEHQLGNTAGTEFDEAKEQIAAELAARELQTGDSSEASEEDSTSHAEGSAPNKDHSDNSVSVDDTPSAVHRTYSPAIDKSSETG